MRTSKYSEYSNKQAIREVLGSIINSPSLLKEYPLTKKDFPDTFHKLIFSAVNNLYVDGIETIDAVAIDDYISHYAIQYKVFTENNGLEYVERITEIALPENIKYYYELLKKFSLLREYKINGIDVSEFFEPDEEDSAEKERKRALLDKSSLNDIIIFYKKKFNQINSEYVVSDERESKRAGSGGMEQKEKWKTGMAWGKGCSSAYLTTVTHGLQKGKLTIKSAGTGVGKTRTSIADLAYACTPKYYNKKLQKWCENPNGISNGALYIGTEMELLEEIDPILWAYIADVPQEHIVFGNYEPGEEERVNEAIRILSEEANIWLEYIPDYNSTALEEVIEQHKLQHNIEHVFFDYIHSTAELISEYSTQSKTRMNIREDQVLAELSRKLKMFSRKYNVSIDTCTQVNGDYKNEANRDQTIVSGAKAILNKADTGMIAMPPTQKELKKIEPITRKFFGLPKPNLVYSVYKNRGGKWNYIKIWLNVEYDTMRVHDLFVTDYNYNLITDIDKTYIDVVDGANTTPHTKILNDKAEESD